MQDNHRLPWQRPMHEHKAASVVPQTMLQILPMSERVDSLVGADLLQEVAGRLPRHLLQLQQLWHEPPTQQFP